MAKHVSTMLLFSLIMILTPTETAGATCHRLLSVAEVDRLVLLTPDAEVARRAGLHVKVVPSGHLVPTGNHLSLTRLLTADRGGPLDNGILGYFTVDRVTGRTFDVNGNIISTPVMYHATRQMLGC